MIVSDLSIKRPVLATVINLLIVILGIAALFTLPIREYPDVETPVVSITTTYIGANAETIESSVTEPLEQVINGINGIKSIRSISSQGVSTVNVEFLTTRDIDDAANDINNVVQSALGKIPQAADKPIIAKSTANSYPLMWLCLLDKRKKYTPEHLSDIADRIVKTPIQVLPGVASVIIGGQRKYAMRVWLDHKKMAAKSITTNDIRKTLLENNLQLPTGQIKGETRQFNIYANGIISRPEIYSNLALKNENGNIIKIKDIGKVELGSANYDTIIRLNGERVVSVGIIKQSKANELKLANDVKKLLPSIVPLLPKDIKLIVAVDNSKFVEASLHEVFNSLIIAFILVILVTLIFLRSISATAIASLSIPISIIGTFFAMKLLGFSINVLTLLGLVLAIGLVVDDAIVVLENIFRYQEKGENKISSAFHGSKEIAFPVIATTISLVSVFIPLSTLTGAVGRQFKEFALTVAFSVAISGIVSLTLIPALCSKYLDMKHIKGIDFIDSFISILYKYYLKALDFSIRKKKLILIFLGINIILSGILIYFTPKTSTPIEDRGLIVTFIKSPQGTTLAYTNRILLATEKIISKYKELDLNFSAIGLAAGRPASPSFGFMYSRLTHWKDRTTKQQDITKSLFPQFMRIKGALIFPTNPPSLGASTLTKDVEVVIKSSEDIYKLEKITNSALAQIKKIPGLINVDTDLYINTPQLNIVFNRERISDNGLTVADVLKSIETLFSENKINTFIFKNKQYDVIPSLYPRYRSKMSNIKNIYLKNKNGILISLDSLIEVKPVLAPSQINHYDLERSVTITGSLTPGSSLGTVLNSVSNILKSVLPKNYSFTFSGISREFMESSFALYITFIISLIFIYLVLAGLFESFIHPFTIILSVPLALLGSFLTLLISHQTLNLYSAIGIILLIGLVTKNAILIVEMSNQAILRGMETTKAVIHACEVRFRPIIMTSMAMILGSLPLVLSTGAGSESRISMGLAIVGGLVFSTVFTLLVVPVVYVIFSRRGIK